MKKYNEILANTDEGYLVKKQIKEWEIRLDTLVEYLYDYGETMNWKKLAGELSEISREMTSINSEVSVDNA